MIQVGDQDFLKEGLNNHLADCHLLIVFVLSVPGVVLYLVTCDDETPERVWFQTSPVTRPTHFNFYRSGALVTYSDITPDLPQAVLADLSLCSPLIGHIYTDTGL